MTDWYSNKHRLGLCAKNPWKTVVLKTDEMRRIATEQQTEYQVPWLRYKRKRKQDRQCTYNVTLRCIRVTVVAVENQEVLHIVSAHL